MLNNSSIQSNPHRQNNNTVKFDLKTINKIDQINDEITYGDLKKRIENDGLMRMEIETEPETENQHRTLNYERGRKVHFFFF